MIFCYQIILSYYLKIIKRKYNILQISIINKTRSDTESPVSERIFIIFASGDALSVTTKAGVSRRTAFACV